MDTLGNLKARVWNELDSDASDPFYPEARVVEALNTALVEAVDRLTATGARRRYMKRVPDLSLEAGFDATRLVWSLPANFRRPFELHRGVTLVSEVRSERDFSTHGPDGYLVVGRELWLTEGTDPRKLEVWYFYMPDPLRVDDDRPDWIEGYEEYLVKKAAALLLSKGDVGDSELKHREADRMWPAIIMAARSSALPTTIRKRPVYGELWY